MNHYTDPRYDHRQTASRDTVDRIRAYLTSRPMESWLFFAVGIIAGAVIS